MLSLKFLIYKNMFIYIFRIYLVGNIFMYLVEWNVNMLCKYDNKFLLKFRDYEIMLYKVKSLCDFKLRRSYS